MSQTRHASLPTDADIAPYAYHVWAAEGRPPGKALEYWLETEAQLLAVRQHEAGRPAAKARIWVASSARSQSHNTSKHDL